LVVLLVMPLAALWADAPRPWWSPRPGIDERIHSAQVNADIERLKRQAQFVVTVEDDAEMARLLIPRKLVKAWQHASLSPARDTAVASARSWSLPTLVAGLALTLSLTLGGLRLAGWRPRWSGAGKVAALLVLAVASVGMVVALVRADVPPGPSPRRPLLPERPDLPREAVVEPLLLKSKVTVEVLPEGEVIQLIVPRSLLAPLVTQPR
jgi:hypothetical protein